MANTTVQIDGSKITDHNSFHAAFKEQMGFPDFYGNNMNAWIDCMGDIHENTKMSKFFLPKDQPLSIVVNDTEAFSKACPDVFAAFLECVSFVNTKRIEPLAAPVQIVFN